MNLALSPDALRRELQRRGKSQSEFARICGVSEPTLSHAATGRSISGSTLQKLARGLADTPVIAGVDDLLAVRPRRPDLATVLANADNIPTKSETVATSTSATASSEAQRVSAETPV